MLDKEFQYYIDHQQELLKEYEGKYIVVKDCGVVGSYTSMEDALTVCIKRGMEPGTFLVQKCTNGDADYTQTFHTRVVFA